MTVACLLARNEADRYLTETITSLRPLVSKILLLDDNSTDRTRELAWDLGCHVRKREAPPMWGNESTARQELWQWGCEETKDWIYISDADHITVADPARWEMLLSSWNVNAWAFPLYDLWTPTQYRADGFWQAHKHPRPWLFRPLQGLWSERGIHTGHAPHADWRVGVAEGCYILHKGWQDATDREEKVARYLSTQDQLSPGELAHLHSVRDPIC